MIHWMIQALIRLAPDQEEISEEARETIYTATASVHDLTFRAGDLIILGPANVHLYQS